MLPSQKVVLLLSLVFLSTQPAWSHPHVWVETSAEIVIQDGAVTGIWAEWIFDEIFSSTLIMDYDRDSNGTFDKTEAADLREDYFDNLRNYHYFSYVYINNQSQPIPKVNEFQVRLLDGKRADYRFFVPISVKLKKGDFFDLGMYDETFFTDMVFRNGDPVKLTIKGKGKATVKIFNDQQHAFYGGQVVPVLARFQWEP